MIADVGAETILKEVRPPFDWYAIAATYLGKHPEVCPYCLSLKTDYAASAHCNMKWHRIVK